MTKNEKKMKKHCKTCQKLNVTLLWVALLWSLCVVVAGKCGSQSQVQVNPFPCDQLLSWHPMDLCLGVLRRGPGTAWCPLREWWILWWQASTRSWPVCLAWTRWRLWTRCPWGSLSLRMNRLRRQIPASHAPTAGVPAHSPDASLLGGGGGPAPRMPGAEEDYHQVGGSGNQWISRSVTYLKQIPRNKLSELIEQIDGTFDATLTSQLTSYGLLCLIWIYTRIVPTVKISDLRAAAAASVSANPVY